MAEFKVGDRVLYRGVETEVVRGFAPDADGCTSPVIKWPHGWGCDDGEFGLPAGTRCHYASDIELIAPATSGAAAHSILTEAAGIVQGARNATHGDKERSFQVIADLWRAYLTGRKDVTCAAMRPVDVANMMALLKIARSIQGTPVRDHYVDGAGYLAIAGELGVAA